MHTTSRTRACAHAQDHMHTMPIKSTCTCVHRKLSLVKILFKKVNYKASFEGREGRAVTGSERKRIPDL